ncbi:MAG: hypothetical protein AB8B63_10585 [Granulosicoccus sp.]
MHLHRHFLQLTVAIIIAGAGHALAAPTVNGSIISWPDDGWYQVQDAETFESLCQGGRSCDVPAGRYIVINHTTGVRFGDVVVNGVQSGIAPVIDGNTISWADDGWYQVQNADTYESLCEGGRTCEVPAGIYNVINLSTGQRFERLEIDSTDDGTAGGGVGVYPSTIDLTTATAPTVNALPWSFNGEPVSGTYVADADGDGFRDFVFSTTAADAAPCETQVVVLSSLADSTALTSGDLPDTLQLSSTLFADKDFDGNGCFNIDSIDNARDINGDGLEDLSLFMDPGFLPNNETFYRSSAVVFGTRTGKALDVASLDGQTGFLITGTRTPIDGIGDINGDGYGEYSFQNSGFFLISEVHLRAGSATVPAQQVAYEILDDPSLAIFDSNTRLAPLGDINADGLADFYSSKDPHGASLHLGSSSGSIVPPTSRYQSISPIGDHDNDGLDDFLVSKYANGCGWEGQISAIIYGSTDNNYLTSDIPIADFGIPGQTRLLSTNSNICGLWRAEAQPLGDVNGDGAEDAKLGNSVLFGTSGRRETVVSAEDLDGTNGFNLVSDYALLDVVGADVDSDGYSDIVVNGMSVVPGMPTIPIDDNGPQQIVVQMRQGEWTVHWESPDNQAVAYSLSVDDYELSRVSNATTAVLSDQVLDEGGILRVSALDLNGNELGSNIRQIPAYEEFGELSATVIGPKAIELPFNGESRFVRGLYFLVWRNNELIDRTFPSGVRSYFDSGVQPGKIYRYYIQPDYSLGDNLKKENLMRWPRLQRASRVVEAWTPLEGVEIPPPGSGVLITDANTLYWPDDGRYVVSNADDGSVLCQGGLACEVPDGTYDVSNLTTGESWSGIVVSNPANDGMPDGIAPSPPGNVTMDIYSARVAELFWDRPPATERVVTTEVYRDGEYLGASRGNSYYDGTREIDNAHWYELIAVDADGDRSTTATLNFMRAAQTLLPDPSNDFRSFEYETALDGNTAVIASSDYLNGSVTILERQVESGLWTIKQQLDGSSDSNSRTIYSSQVELSGNTLAVNAQVVTDGEYSADMLLIHTRNEVGTWVETQRLNRAASGNDSLSIDGNTMAVRRDSGIEILARNTASGQWLSTQLIEIEQDGFYPDRMVLAGDQLLVGWTGHQTNGVETGAVYLYHRTENGMFLLQQQLVPESATQVLNAGRSIAFDGETVVFSVNGGSMFIFERNSEGNYEQTAELDAIGPDYVTPRLAVDSDRLLAGTPEGTGLVNYSGFVAVFEKQGGGGWIEATRLVPETGTRSFGRSVGLENNRALIGGRTSAVEDGTIFENEAAIGHYYEFD